MILLVSMFIKSFRAQLLNLSHCIDENKRLYDTHCQRVPVYGLPIMSLVVHVQKPVMKNVYFRSKCTVSNLSYKLYYMLYIEYAFSVFSVKYCTFQTSFVLY